METPLLGSISDLSLARGCKSVLAGLAIELQCTVCLDRLQSPRIFSCMHLMCQHCCITYARTALGMQSSGWVGCPTCRVPTFLRLSSTPEGNWELSLPVGEAHALVEKWITSFDRMEKHSIVPFRKQPFKVRLRDVEQSYRHGMSRLNRLNIYEQELRKSLLTRAADIKKSVTTSDDGHFNFDSEIGALLFADYDSSIRGLWRSRLSAIRECERWRAARCLIELVIAIKKMPSEVEMDDLFVEIDAFLAQTLQYEPTIMDAVSSPDVDANIVESWRLSFYESAFAASDASAVESFQDSNSNKTCSGGITVRVVWCFEERGSQTGQFFWPVDVAFVRVLVSALQTTPTTQAEHLGDKTATVLAVADKNNRRVQLFDVVLGKYVGSFAHSIKCKRIAQDDNGIIYVTDEEACTVKMFNENLEFLYAWNNSIFKYATGLAITNDGEVIMTDAELGFISRHQGAPSASEKKALTTLSISPAAGRVMGKFTAQSVNDESKPNPYYVVHDPRDDCIYASDSYNHRIKVFGREGIPLNSLSGFVCPRGLVIDYKGNLIVADSGNSRVVVLTSSGKLIQVLIWDIENPMGLAYWSVEDSAYLAVTQAGYTSCHGVSLYRLEEAKEPTIHDELDTTEKNASPKLMAKKLPED